MSEENLDNSKNESIASERSEHSDQISVIENDGSIVSLSADLIAPNDFVSPLLFGENEFNSLNELNQRFISYLMPRISMNLRTDLVIEGDDIKLAPMREFCSEVTEKTYITQFSIDSFPGSAFCVIPDRLAVYFASRMLGGRVEKMRDGRELTEIEIALIDEVVRGILEEWGRQWENLQILSVDFSSGESGARSLKLINLDEQGILWRINFKIGDEVESASIIVPYGTLEPLINKICSFNQPKQSLLQSSSSKVFKSSKIFAKVQAHWSLFDISVQDVSSFKSGDIFKMPNSVDCETKLLVDGAPYAKGILGIEDNKIVVKIKR